MGRGRLGDGNNDRGATGATGANSSRSTKARRTPRGLPAAILVPAVSGLYICARKGAAVASFHNFTLASARFTSTGNSTSNSNAASMSSGFMKCDNVNNDDIKTMPTSVSTPRRRCQCPFRRFSLLPILHPLPFVLHIYLHIYILLKLSLKPSYSFPRSQ
ncbi:hypothetical protein B0H13DRAFT_2107839 [Mycena leptocephala]|nr:hypothetical protein B0H13DRAFT_2107839 [Mycena leptocephala]